MLADACSLVFMGKSSAPPIDGKRIRRERLRLRMTQVEMCQACAERGYKLAEGNLSRIENGLIKWPALRGLPVIAEVLGVEVDDLWDAEEDEPNGVAA